MLRVPVLALKQPLSEWAWLNNFFRLLIHALVAKIGIGRQSCAMVPRWRLFVYFLRPGPVYQASRAQHISDLHSKFALRPYHVWKYMVDMQSNLRRVAENRQEKKKKERRNHRTKI